MRNLTAFLKAHGFEVQEKRDTVWIVEQDTGCHSPWYATLPKAAFERLEAWFAGEDEHYRGDQDFVRFGLERVIPKLIAQETN